MFSRLQPHVPRMATTWAVQTPTSRSLTLDGSLVFADISGFTRLSERLARRGRVGAEDLVTIINACFGQLLATAYGRGASLLKFGGDALLLWFDGDAHALRAAGAAAEMRAQLNAFGRAGANVDARGLQISIGIHSDRFQFFLVGGSHRELVITGLGASTVVACEQAAGGGEIVVSRTTGAMLDSRDLGSSRPPGVLLRGFSQAAPPASIQAPASMTDGELAPLVSAGIRDVLLSGALEPEHRDACLAFVRFSGVDAMLADQGPDLVATALDGLVRAAQIAVEEEGITFLTADIDRDGGKIYLVAGAPFASDRDEEKLLRAVRAIVDSHRTLPLSAGIHRGHVFTGLVGTPFRQTYAVMGDPVNLAARLAARAGPGEIVATPDVLDRSRTLFHVTRLEPFQVKGKRDPVQAFAVGPVEGVRPSPVTVELPLYGRDRELALLRSVADTAAQGHGDLVELVGDPGMGKSRLVSALHAQTPALRCFSVQCEPYESSTPYSLARPLLHTVLDVLLTDDPTANSAVLTRRLDAVVPELVPWIPLLAVPLNVPVLPTPQADDVDPIFRRPRIHAVVRTLLARLLTDPTMLVFEDAHWMDEASAELLLHLVEHVRQYPWLIVATRRPEDAGFAVRPGTHAVTIHLTPLTPADARALAVAAAGQAATDQAGLALIAERSAGNPLFLRELVATSIQGGPRTSLPESVQAVIASRIDRLRASDRTVLRYASVLGATFQQDIVSAALEPYGTVTTDPLTWDRLATFIDVDLDGTCHFKHALFREVAYEGLSFARRREIHGRVGEVYEARLGTRSDEAAELLSLHFSLAGISDKTWRYSLVAGDRARAKYANPEAAAFYRRALAAGRQVPPLTHEELGRAWESLGDVCELSAHYEEADRAYGESRRTTDHGSIGDRHLLRKQGVLRERQGRYAAAIRWYARALDGLDRLAESHARSSLEIQLRLAYAGVRIRQGRFRDAVQWADAARVHAKQIGDRAATAHAYYLLHLAHTSLGSPDRLSFRGLALPIYEQLGDLVKLANVLNNLGVDAYYEGRWEEALHFYERDHATRERAGDVVGAATSLNNIGEIKSDQGHLEEAAQLFEQAAAITRAAGYRLLPIVTQSNLGRVAARSGRFDEAHTALMGAIAGFEQMGARGFLAETRARLAELAVLSGDAQRGLQLTGETMTMAAREGGTRSLQAMLNRVQAWARMQREEYEPAAEALATSERIARTDGARYELALTLQAMGQLARLKGSVDERAEAESRELFRSLGIVRIPTVPLPVAAAP